MLTYQVRRRVFRHEPGAELTLPGKATIDVYFLPPEPFGEKGPGGRTVVRARAASVLFSGNSGVHYVEQREPLQPINVTIDESPTRTLTFNGRHLSLEQHFDDLRELADFLLALQFGLTVLLNLPFADPPVVERIAGKVGDHPFRWELANWRFDLRTTMQDAQEEAIAAAWERMPLLNSPVGTRLHAALTFFHVACRLQGAGNTPWEFMAEVLINLAKVLEALFPPGGDVKSIDAARKGLSGLRFSSDEVEQYFTPAIALRNQIDSGHVDFTLFTIDQLTLIHRYSSVAEQAFRLLFERLIRRLERDLIVLSPVSVEDRKPDRGSLVVLERLAQHYSGDDEPVLRVAPDPVAG